MVNSCLTVFQSAKCTVCVFFFFKDRLQNICLNYLIYNNVVFSAVKGHERLKCFLEYTVILKQWQLTRCH